MEKSALRQDILRDFASISPAERADLSRRLARNLLAWPELGEPKAVMAFLSMDDELDTDPLISAALEAGHRIYAPKTLRKSRRMIPIRLTSLQDVKSGAYGIREPAGDERLDPSQLDVVVVPAVAFDRRGFRLGRGGGYYDRFLELLNPKAQACGVAFERYVLDRVPIEDHDLPVQTIVTEVGITRIKV